MSDDRKIELTLAEIVLMPVELRARADACSSSSRAASRLLNLIADKIDALPKPRMAEPTEFGAIVTTLDHYSQTRVKAIRADDGSAMFGQWYVPALGDWFDWEELLDPEPLP